MAQRCIRCNAEIPYGPEATCGAADCEGGDRRSPRKRIAEQYEQAPTSLTAKPGEPSVSPSERGIPQAERLEEAADAPPQPKAPAKK